MLQNIYDVIYSGTSHSHSMVCHLTGAFWDDVRFWRAFLSHGSMLGGSITRAGLRQVSLSPVSRDFPYHV